MAYKSVYYSGQGKVFLTLRNADGSRGESRFIGNAPEFEVSLELDKEDVKDSTEGTRLIDLTLVKERKGSIKLTIYSAHAENVALMVGGTQRTISSGSASSESIQAANASNIAADTFYKTKHENISSVVVNRGATPLVLNTDYAIDDAAFGRIRWITAQPGGVSALTINYSYTTRTQITIFDASTTERILEFHGKNTANGDKKIFIELYRVVLDPAKALPVINDETAKFELEGTILSDPTRVADANLGGFGRISQVDAQPFVV